MSKTTKLMIKLENTHARNLLRLTALKRFYTNTDVKATDINRKKTKSKERMLSDEEIKNDLNTINTMKYEIGAKVKLVLIDEEFFGEIVKVDAKEVTVKLENGERLKVNMNSLKNEISRIVFL